MEQVIYLIDDHDAVRESLSVLLATMGWKTETFASAQAFLEQKQPLDTLCGCLLLDIRMPGKTGLTLLDELQQQAIPLPVVLMTGHGNIETCRRAFKNGAFEFLTKPIDADLLIETVSAAFDHQQKVYQQQLQHQQLQNKFDQLSEREREVMQSIIEGNTSKQIARILALSPRTVEAHRANIFSKLAITSLAQLVKEHEILNFLSKTK